MKPFLLPVQGKVLLLPVLFILSFFQSTAQCNVNDKYDKIISGYHSSIAIKDNGTYAVWGSSMSQTGAADIYAPQDINTTNYTALTGTIYKAALGGKSAGAAVDQGILLTSDGLWAWGIVGNVLKSTVKSAAAFGRITSPSGGVGSTTLGLPTGVTPTDVQSIFATYQTLILLTKIVNNVGGDVYMLTQTSLADEANGGTVGTAGSSTWQRVKIDASTYLTNVNAVRGQVYNTTNNAFIASTTGGLLYTWGNTTYTGNGSAVAARNYATLMTLPTESAASIIPKMIGVTGGGASGATTVKNTYYVLSTTGNLYSLGDNSQKQCGDFTSTERTSWVQVKKSSTANDYLTNVNFFSCQEHNASYPAIAAVTTNGALYTWGNNSSGMLARSDNGAVGGNLTTTTFDPGLTAGVSGTVISAEMGGHTLVYLKEGSNQFCYAGHYTNGSMGDGGSGNNGSSSASTLLLNCASTPNIAICGYVPVAASTIYSSISTALNAIAADGSSITNITVQLKDASGNNLTSSGGTVDMFTTAGTLSTVTDNNNGTYSATLTSAATPGTASLSFTINGNLASGANSSVSVTFNSPLALTWLNVHASRQSDGVKISWTTTNETNVKSFTIERSYTAADWQEVMTGIKANNIAGTSFYSQTDVHAPNTKVYYRIRQEDMDGHYTYSATQFIAAKTDNNSLVIYPVPVTSGFQLLNNGQLKISRIILVNSNGADVRSWTSVQASYDIKDIAPGIYYLRIELADGDVQMLRLSKQ
ncbi:MAG: T9SS type A sorting domain-containing protein [Bacteroidetes bacterium]|nr:T9SS type A sorting domain-containing protein [Bacteroidota bacterium]